MQLSRLVGFSGNPIAPLEKVGGYVQEIRNKNTTSETPSGGSDAAFVNSRSGNVSRKIGGRRESLVSETAIDVGRPA